MILRNGEYVVNFGAATKNRALLEARGAHYQLKLAGGSFVRATTLPSFPADSGHRFSITSTSYFAPTIPITVQPSGNKETDSNVVESLRSELDTLLEKNMADFAANESSARAAYSTKRAGGADYQHNNINNLSCYTPRFRNT